MKFTAHMGHNNCYIENRIPFFSGKVILSFRLHISFIKSCLTLIMYMLNGYNSMILIIP